MRQILNKLKIAKLNFGREQLLSTLPFDCTVERSRRKTMTVYIIKGKVVVRCPLRESEKQIFNFLNENKDWITQRVSEETVRLLQVLRVEPGLTIFYHARELTIVFRQASKARVLVEGNKFIIEGRDLTPAKAKSQLEEFLIKKAKDYILPRARGLAHHLGVERKLKEIKLRKTKTKWGHCTSTGDIQYNYLIMLAPFSIIDYMITHEVCHLRHMDHSRRFWDLVESLCPNSKHYMRWLKENEHRFWL